MHHPIYKGLCLPLIAIFCLFVASPVLAQEIQVQVSMDASIQDPTAIESRAVSLAPGGTALDAVAQAFDATIVDSSYGPYVTALQGHAHPQGGWTFTVNGQAPPVGASQVVLEDGDQLAWTLVVFEMPEPEIPAYQAALGQLEAYIAAQDIASPWHTIALAQSQKAGSDLLAPAQTRAAQALESRKWTDKEKSILELRALGQDQAAQALIDQVRQASDLQARGNNALIYGLLALRHTDQNLAPQAWVDQLLAAQNPDGSFSVVAGQDGDVDMTAMALQALAPYDKVAGDAIQAGLAYLANAQRPTGDYSNAGTPNAESTAQVLIALSSLGIDPASDDRFIKDGKTVLDALLTYQNDDGSFRHDEGGQANGFATEQVHLALVAYDRLVQGGADLWTFPAPAFEFTDANDIAPWAREDLAQAYEKGLIAGYPDGSFQPKQTVSRAEATVLLARVYDWPQGNPAGLPFADVSSQAWYRPVLAGAYEQGYAAGVAADRFAPDMAVDRQTFAVLMSRAYDLPVTRAHVVFVDEDDIAPWAKAGVQAMANAGLMVGTSEDAFGPQDPISREQAAVILNRLDAKLQAGAETTRNVA